MHEGRAHSFWVTGISRGELRSAPLREVQAGEVLVRTLYTAVSRGTETLVWRGEVPPSEHERMRAPFQEGNFPAPVKYGYIAVGVVEEGPDALLGKQVFALHPHQDRFIVPADAIRLLPDGVPPGRAVLAANMETAINGLWDGAPKLGDRIAVIGAGVVGLLVAKLASEIPGTEVRLTDPEPSKVEVAKRLGLECVGPENAFHDADLVFHTSGHPDGLSAALEIAGFEARIVDLSWYGTKPVSLPLGGAFHARRLTLISSQVGHIPAHQAPRWDYRRRIALALDLLKNPVFDALISGEDNFSDLPRVMARITEDNSVLCHRIAYS